MNSDTLKGQWKQLAGRAKAQWSDITDDEFLKVEGNVQRLSGLVQERYGLAREEAEKQVQKFIDGVQSTLGKAKRGIPNSGVNTPP